jgi:hypothetical protein
MAWLNADDIYAPGALLTVGEIFATLPEVRWMHGHPASHDEANRTVDVHDRRVWSRYSYLLGDFHWVNQDSTFWRRGLWEEAGARVDDALRYAGDLELWARFFRHAQLYTAGALLGGFRSRTGQASTVHRAAYLDETHRVLARERKRLDRTTATRYTRIRRLKAVFDALDRLRVLDIGALKRKLGYYDLLEFPRYIRYNFQDASYELREPWHAWYRG